MEIAKGSLSSTNKQNPLSRIMLCILALLVVEKRNQLLMKNHNERLVGSQAVLEAHAIIHKYDSRRGRGRGQGQGNTSWSH